MMWRNNLVGTVVLSACLANANAESPDITVSFVEMLAEDGNALVVVELINSGSEVLNAVNYVCWTEDRSKVDVGSAAGSRYRAFNTGRLTWNGKLDPGKKTTSKGIIQGFPGDMVTLFEDQFFTCNASKQVQTSRDKRKP